MTDFRALCAELHAAFNTYAVDEAHHDLLVRARAALAQPEPQELNHEAAARHTVESCLSQREEVLAAFIAKHGFCPDEAIQIEQRQEDGSATWRIERRAALAEHPVGPRMVYHYSPVTVAECGGPCEQGPQYCDCGEIKGEPASKPVRPTDEELLKLTENVSTEHAARRPKPPSLKEQELLQLDTLNADPVMHDTGCYLFQMRRALEQLTE